MSTKHIEIFVQFYLTRNFDFVTRNKARDAVNLNAGAAITGLKNTKIAVYFVDNFFVPVLNLFEQ